MQTNNNPGRNDPRGYYAILGLDASASDQHIRATYKRRAMDLHPDRNPGRDTTELFQQLVEAYETLGTPAKRADYDAIKLPPKPAKVEIPEPIRCSRCDKVSAQPRVVIFKTVKSFLVVTLRKPVSGIFCSDCAQKEGLKASAITWVMGWWGFPWGPMYTAQALLGNLFGGTKPALENARILSYQAYYFYIGGRPEIAQSIAKDGLAFARKVATARTKPGAAQLERDKITGQLDSLIAECGAATMPQLKSTWGLWHKTFFAQASVIAISLAAVTLILVNLPAYRNSLPHGPTPYATMAEPSATPTLSAPAPATRPWSAVPPISKPPAYVRQPFAPNGKPWPSVAGYLFGEPQRQTGGRSEVTIDNRQNDSDIFAKLMSLDGTLARPARQVFIPAHTQFTLKFLQAGQFEVRYRDLESGVLSRSETLNLMEVTTTRGVEYSVVRLTLHKVQNGNMADNRLGEGEF